MSGSSPPTPPLWGTAYPPPPHPPPVKTQIWGGQFGVLIFPRKFDFSKGVGVVLKSRVCEKNFPDFFTIYIGLRIKFLWLNIIRKSRTLKVRDLFLSYFLLFFCFLSSPCADITPGVKQNIRLGFILI